MADADQCSCVDSVSEAAPEVICDPREIRADINEIEAALFEHPQVEIPVTHHFTKGIYAREILIPKGTLLTGKIHRFAHMNIISQGDISVLTENGVKRIKAPFTMVSPPNTKRIGYAHEDTVWTTIHGTDETDLDALELELIAPTHALVHEEIAIIEEIEQCHG